MNAQVLLLRGINVGGHGRLPMADLRSLLDGLGAGGARTHVQSGNAVCPHAVDAAALADRIHDRHGFRPGILTLGAADWHKRIATNPFPTDTPTALHGFFHDGPAAQTGAMTALAGPTEALRAFPGILWLHAPDGIGRSRLAARVERLAGCPMTARNWNTIAALTALLEDF